VPPSSSTLGHKAATFARRHGIALDRWQRAALVDLLGKREDGAWAAREGCLVVPRQNGKTEVLLARALYGLYELHERLVVYSAHQWDTSLEAFRRLLDVIESSDELSARVKKVRHAAAQEGVELDDGCRVRFRTRSRGGARGFSADLVVFDEAAFLPEAVHAALVPTLSARSATAQVLYAAAACDQLYNADGVVLAGLRERGLAGDDPALAYLEYSAAVLDDTGAEVPLDRLTAEMLADVGLWEQANPAMPARIDAEHVAWELRAMAPRGFGCERLCIGDYPRTDGELQTPIHLDDWLALVDEDSEPIDPVCIAFDVSPDRRSSIAVAGRRADGHFHVEIVDAREGTGWLVPRLGELVGRHEPWLVVADAYGPAGIVVEKLEDAGVSVERVTAGQLAQSCGLLLDMVSEATVRHLGSAELTAALKGAATRPLGDAWAWRRRYSTADISPLVSATLSLWAAAGMPEDDDVVIY
jgi:hypothetical protein